MLVLYQPEYRHIKKEEKEMKKVLAVVLASMMVLSLAACGGDDKKEETQAPESKRLRLPQTVPVMPRAAM